MRGSRFLVVVVLLVALVAILMIGVVSVFGSNVRSWFLARTASITTV